MSETVHYSGKLIKINQSPNETLDSLCERICKENKVTERSKYNNNWIEQLLDRFYDDYVVVKDTLFKIEDKRGLDFDYDVFNASVNPDGTINFDVMYYNGGCCLTEALEEALSNIDISEIKAETTRSRIEDWLNKPKITELNLTDTGTNPRCIENILLLNGYKIANTENSGCTKRVYFNKGNYDTVQLFICTETFELNLYREIKEKASYGLDLVEDFIAN